MLLVISFFVFFGLLMVDEHFFDKACKIAAKKGLKTNIYMMLSGIYFYMKVKNK